MLIPSRTDKKLDTSTDISVIYLFRLYLDGRNNISMKNVRNTARHGHRDRVREEHVIIICEPCSAYFGHVMCMCISKATFNVTSECLTRRSVDFNSVEIVGCDGTVANTGRSREIIQQLEELLQKKLYQTFYQRW